MLTQAYDTSWYLTQVGVNARVRQKLVLALSDTSWYQIDTNRCQVNTS